MYRNTYLEINLDCLLHNAEYFINKTGKKLIAVVKANGYGTIDYMEARTLQEIGVDFFAVSSLDEAINLRKNGITDEILILGSVPEDMLDMVRKNDFSIVTLSKDFVMNANLKKVKIHLKLDTGMNRIGIKPSEAREVMKILKKKEANIEGIMSHFSSADTDKEYSESQYYQLKNCYDDLDYEFKYIHMSATDASFIVKDNLCNANRIGLGLLGYSSYENDLKPVVRLYSEVSAVKQLKEGETVSYGRHYTSDGKGYILTIPIGYADGFWRSNTGKEVYVDGEFGKIVGSICMDQMMVWTENFHEVGTKVELFGEHIDLNLRARELDTIVYELLTGFSDRLTRVFVRNGRTMVHIDPRFGRIY